jgi:hypothetical protein
MGIGAAVGGIVGGLFQKSAADKATSAQTKAANQQIALQREIYDDQTRRFSPFLGSGTNALAAYNFEMGLGDRPMVGGVAPTIEAYDLGGKRGTGYRVGGQEFATRAEAEAYANANRTGGTPYAGFTATPGYGFRFQQGIDAIDASAAARGGLMSGRTLQDLTAFGQGIASDEYGNYMNRLGGLSDMGMGAAGMQATAGNNFAAGAGNALANRGNAQAAGAIAGGNAMAGMFNNLGAAFGYMKQPGSAMYGGGR